MQRPGFYGQYRAALEERLQEEYRGRVMARVVSEYERRAAAAIAVAPPRTSGADIPIAHDAGRESNPLWCAAVEEAAHAVLGITDGATVDSLRINAEGTEGWCRFSNAHRLRPGTMLAGVFAYNRASAAVVASLNDGRHDNDRYEAARISAMKGLSPAELEAETGRAWRAVRDYWPTITALAQRLIDRGGSLGAAEIAKVVGQDLPNRSWYDVAATAFLDLIAQLSNMPAKAEKATR